jgi:hypothetical protein
MLLSGQFSDLVGERAWDRDFLTYSIILVIVSSFAILCTSLIREIILARSMNKNMAAAKWRAAIRKQMVPFPPFLHSFFRSFLFAFFPSLLLTPSLSFLLPSIFTAFFRRLPSFLLYF